MNSEIPHHPITHPAPSPLNFFTQMKLWNFNPEIHPPTPNHQPSKPTPKPPDPQQPPLLVVQLLLRSSPQIRQRCFGIPQGGVPVEGRRQ